MQLFLILVSVAVILGIGHIFRWYKPKIDIVYSKGHYEYLLWYNKFSNGNFISRKYIKLFTI